MKELPQRELRRAAGELQLASVATTPTLAHGLTYGVDLLPRHPIEAARTGATARVPLIIGTNRHEASLFARDKPPMLPTTPANIDRYFARLAPEARARVLAAYPGYPRRRALEAIGADAMFVAPTWAFADAYSAHAPTYVYRFDHTSCDAAGDGPGRGARQRDRAHLAQLRLAFGPTAAPAGQMADARGGPPDAADLAGIRHRRPVR